MKKIVISIGIGILIIAVAIGIVKLMNGGRKEVKKESRREAALVEVISPTVGDITFTAEATGKLLAVERFQIVSEVSGQLQKQALAFKEGKKYHKGQTMLVINSREFAMGLIANKSNFITTITSVLADLKYDYPDAYKKWYDYVKSIEVDKPLPQIPASETDKEKFYLVGKGLHSQYYNIKASEERLSKYTIRAPYEGIVTFANAVEGEAVNPGSRLGTFISTNAFDLELTYPIRVVKHIKIGTKTSVSATDFEQSWTGKVVRIGGSIDNKTQSIKVFVRVQGYNLLEGMYLTARVKMQPIKNAMTISRKLIDNDNNVFVVVNNQLQIKRVEVVEESGDKAVIKGLDADDKVMITVIKSAYNGMPVRLE